MSLGSETDDPSWHRYWAIVDNNKPGLAMPVLWHAALRGRRWALLELSTRIDAGRLADPFSGAGLARRAWRKGLAAGAQYLAMDAFNHGQIGAYR